ncbi:helix-turn-helix domain-containing protein [Thalassobaculum litoreum]|uniref:Helix-turn-helix domain-containing protein n=1 Tax=Thalassobaculum litoreum DSM 18839 TaxID=1123362 RepID=A0A8G2BK59_9PROT|nr:helix-turn-helix transcriptional regulator [Thalassobaculum litoreum]SDF84232.1 Helix-turn-helix domain-containing protein [Thalassobaculum litoreum DSM 18839]
MAGINTVDTSGMALRIRDLRKQHRLSLDEVARRAGCSKTHVWELEQGRAVNPTLSTALSIATALGVSLDYLVGITAGKPKVPAHLAVAIGAVMDVAEAAYERGKAESQT